MPKSRSDLIGGIARDPASFISEILNLKDAGRLRLNYFSRHLEEYIESTGDTDNSFLISWRYVADKTKFQYVVPDSLRDQLAYLLLKEASHFEGVYNWHELADAYQNLPTLESPVGIKYQAKGEREAFARETNNDERSVAIILNNIATILHSATSELSKLNDAIEKKLNKIDAQSEIIFNPEAVNEHDRAGA